MGVKIENGPGSDLARSPLAQRTLVDYRASCRSCEDYLPTPREARAHATAHHHTVFETRHSTLVPQEEQ